MQPHTTYRVTFTRSIMQLSPNDLAAELEAKKTLRQSYPNVDFREYDVEVAFVEQRKENSCYEVFFRDHDYVSVPMIASGNGLEDVIDTIKCNYVKEHLDFGVTESELTVEELPYF